MTLLLQRLFQWEPPDQSRCSAPCVWLSTGAGGIVLEEGQREPPSCARLSSWVLQQLTTGKWFLSCPLATRLWQFSVESEAQKIIKAVQCLALFNFSPAICPSLAGGSVPWSEGSFPFSPWEPTRLCHCSGSRPETWDVNGPQLIVWPGGV